MWLSAILLESVVCCDFGLCCLVGMTREMRGLLLSGE